MPEMIGKVEFYKCNWCANIYSNKRNAECAFKHARENYANVLLRDGLNLENINWLCGFNWKLSNIKKRITRHNCFIIPHWQCCNKPAYRITAINSSGYIFLSGVGAGSGYYGDVLPVDALPEPHPQEELFIYGENDKI